MSSERGELYARIVSQLRYDGYSETAAALQKQLATPVAATPSNQLLDMLQLHHRSTPAVDFSSSSGWAIRT